MLARNPGLVPHRPQATIRARLQKDCLVAQITCPAEKTCANCMHNLQAYIAGDWVNVSKISTTGEPDDAASATAESVARDAADVRAWRDLLALDARLHEQRNVRLLTPEARILMHLKLSGPVPVTTAMQVAGTSQRGFYAVLERLKQAGIVATVKDGQDQRVRNLSIDPSVQIPSVDH